MLAVAHFLEQAQGFFYRAVAPRRVLAGFGQGAAVSRICSAFCSST
jgi:hypothetical protein